MRAKIHSSNFRLGGVRRRYLSLLTLGQKGQEVVSSFCNLIEGGVPLISLKGTTLDQSISYVDPKSRKQD